MAIKANIGKFSHQRGGPLQVLIEMEGLRELLRSIKAVHSYVNIRAARAVAVVAIDLLTYTNPRVPWETGKLRGSGRAYFVGGRQGLIEVAKSRIQEGPDAPVDADLARLKSKDFSKTDKVTSLVSYSRISPKGFDIAEWTHQWINAARSPTGPRARQFGTGPKYLENTFNARKDKYIQFLFNVFRGSDFEKDIIGATKIRNRKTGKFEVDVTEIVHSAVRNAGWKKSWKIM